jgi:hypothetical protein
MVISISENRKVSVSQPAYARKIVKLFGLEQSEVVETPYFADLFLAHADSPALQNVAMFQSQLMSLAFLTRTRPELRVGIAALSVFQQHPTERHLEQLVAMAKFVNGTLDAGLEFEPSNMQLRGSVDAAFGNHMDFKSHTGILLWFGVRNAPVEAISKKQTITSRSSTESEMVALCAGSENALCVRAYVEWCGFPQGTTILYQDNKSCIMLQETGPGATGRGRFINIKWFYVHDLIVYKIVSLEFQVSASLVADGLTKGLTGIKFVEFAWQARNQARL